MTSAQSTTTSEPSLGRTCSRRPDTTLVIDGRCSCSAALLAALACIWAAGVGW